MDKLYNIVGTDDLEGVIFARCTTEEKAKKAMNLLNIESIEISVDNFTNLDTIRIGDELIKL